MNSGKKTKYEQNEQNQSMNIKRKKWMNEWIRLQFKINQIHNHEWMIGKLVFPVYVWKPNSFCSGHKLCKGKFVFW